MAEIAGLVALVLFTFPAFADTDGDGIQDVLDNCTEVANAVQCDTDLDGYGNHCDGDFDDDGDTDINDLNNGFFPLLNMGPGLGDMDCDGDTDINDLTNGFFPRLNQGPNGPSGLSCAGDPPCPDSDGDESGDSEDNCILVANPDQCDTDQDGFGNACDGDFDNDNEPYPRVNNIDFVDYFLADWNQTGETNTDMDCDRDVDTNDRLNFWTQQYDLGVPGPSALASVTSIGELVQIPASTQEEPFIMGWVKDTMKWGPNGAPCNINSESVLAHRVQIPSYEISATEVTRSEWSEVMGTEVHTESPGCGQCPAEVNWFSAAKYANALSARMGLDECYAFTGCTTGDPGADPGEGGFQCPGSASGLSVTAPNGDPYLCTGYRLPTEAEWEKAARGDDPLTMNTWTYAGNPDPAHVDVNDPDPNRQNLYCTGYGDGHTPLFDDQGNSTGKVLADIAWWEGAVNGPYYIARTGFTPATQPVMLKDPVYVDGAPIYDIIGNAAEWVFDKKFLWQDDPRHNQCSELDHDPDDPECEEEGEVTVNPYGIQENVDNEENVHNGDRTDRGPNFKHYDADDVTPFYRSGLNANTSLAGFRVVRTLSSE